MAAGNENVVITRLSIPGRSAVARRVARTGEKVSAVVRSIVDEWAERSAKAAKRKKVKAT